jgi:hypothetical protein
MLRAAVAPVGTENRKRYQRYAAFGLKASEQSERKITRPEASEKQRGTRTVGARDSGDVVSSTIGEKLEAGAQDAGVRPGGRLPC